MSVKSTYEYDALQWTDSRRCDDRGNVFPRSRPSVRHENRCCWRTEAVKLDRIEFPSSSLKNHLTQILITAPHVAEP